MLKLVMGDKKFRELKSRTNAKTALERGGLDKMFLKYIDYECNDKQKWIEIYEIEKAINSVAIYLYKDKQLDFSRIDEKSLMSVFKKEMPNCFSVIISDAIVDSYLKENSGQLLAFLRTLPKYSGQIEVLHKHGFVPDGGRIVELSSKCEDLQKHFSKNA